MCLCVCAHRHVQISRLPFDLGDLVSLRFLQLSSNYIQELPPSIGQCVQLRELHLSHNSLLTLPAEIARLTSLTHLDISYNGLVSLPPGMSQLVGLHTLNLKNNQLPIVPVALGGLTNIRTLDLTVNPLRADMMEKYEQFKATPKQFVSYLAMLYDAGAYPPLCTASGDGLSKARPNDPAHFTIQVSFEGKARVHAQGWEDRVGGCDCARSETMYTHAFLPYVCMFVRMCEGRRSISVEIA